MAFGNSPYMARFYFNIIDGENLIPDGEGRILANIEAAELEARASARDLAIQEIAGTGKVDGRKIEVTDTNGHIVLTLPVHDVVPGLQN